MQQVRIGRSRRIPPLLLVSLLASGVLLWAFSAYRTDTTVVGLGADTTQPDTTPKDTTGNGGGSANMLIIGLADWNTSKGHGL